MKTSLQTCNFLLRQDHCRHTHPFQARASRLMQHTAGLRHVVGSLPKSIATRPCQLRFASEARFGRNAPARARKTIPKQPPPALTVTGSAAAKPEPEPPIWSQKKEPEPLAWRSRALPWVLASIMGGIMAFYGASLYVSATQPCNNPNIALLSEQRDVAARYEDTADSFDSEVGFSEWLMGVNKIRKELAQKCHGHVLEVSCGTGRNLGYYDDAVGGKVDSLTFVDLSPQMVEVCKKKWKALFERTQSYWLWGRIKPSLIVRFLPASALGQMPLAPTDPPKKYDTIIQTMGLCSTASPVELVANMVQYLDTSKPDSRIYLLEHGRSYQEWLNRILDNSAEKHAEIHGCWFNRDIGALVEEAAAKTGLEVTVERRHHLGTTWVFELKPKERVTAVQVPSEPEEGKTEPKPVDEKPAKRWFTFNDNKR